VGRPPGPLARHHLLGGVPPQRDLDDVPECHPGYIGPTQADEFLILVHVAHPEALLRRLDPDVRAAYEDDAFGDDERFGTPIRIGADDLDAPVDEVIAEFERYSKTLPRAR
jgi:hypothetical protein